MTRRAAVAVRLQLSGVRGARMCSSHAWLIGWHCPGWSGVRVEQATKPSNESALRDIACVIEYGIRAARVAPFPLTGAGGACNRQGCALWSAMQQAVIVGKGRGLIAVTDLPVGMCLIDEAPAAFIISCSDACEHCGRWTRRPSDALRLALEQHPRLNAHEGERMAAQALAAANIRPSAQCLGVECCCGKRWCSEHCRLAGSPSHAMLCNARLSTCPLWNAPGHFRLYVAAIARAIVDAIVNRSSACFLDGFCYPDPVPPLTNEVESAFLTAVAPSVDQLRIIFEDRLALYASHERQAAVPIISQWLTPQGYGRFHRIACTNGQDIFVPTPVTDLVTQMLATAPTSVEVQACIQACLQLDLVELGGSGQAIYPTHSRLNHSCAPNAVVVRNGAARAIVNVVRPIGAGEEVCISYLGPVQVDDASAAEGQKMDTHARRLELRDRYSFWCCCAVCSCHCC